MCWTSAITPDPELHERPDREVISDLISGYNGGKWNGPGMIPSAAAATSGQLRIGYAERGSGKPGRTGIGHH